MRFTVIRLAVVGLGLAAMPAYAQNSTAPAAVLNGGDAVAAQADGVTTPSVSSLLSQAEQATRQGRLPLASELIERAETQILTRSTIAGTETIPVREGVIAKMAEARMALGRRDIPAATTAMAEAAGMTRGM
ncbi:hypothetical protein GXW78_22885 [Roseomonas terrae]|jgi:hypothetical protein|uniref:DUF4168 domain-containing protein n=1 Tax=Neoroseomonas terrae TaxID=424799 RepID=A0ABS5ENI8_9PROT|nr:hypothetical protein [Neoroseomonas terrae]MBR0652520.1 hypothetical protein [Neoroseomonas terrae]